MTEAIRTAAPEIVLSACDTASLYPPAEAFLAAGLFSEAARTIEALLARPSEGAFRMGARAMKAAAIERVEELEAYHAAGAIIADAPLPEMTLPANDTKGWAWWSGPNSEYYSNGPFETREEAIAALDGDAGHIVEAKQGAVSFSAESLINDQYFEGDGFDWDNMEPDRTGDVDACNAADAELQSLLNTWVDRWRHTFVTPNMFAASRGEEAIAAVTA